MAEADLLDVQELVEIIGRSTGIALMAPPTDSKDAQTTLDTLLSAVNKKQKVPCTVLSVQELFDRICLHCTASKCHSMKVTRHVGVKTLAQSLQDQMLCRSCTLHESLGSGHVLFCLEEAAARVS